MGQYRTQEKVIRQQEMQIQELSHMLTLLQEENSLLRELSGQLKKENEMLRRHLEDYACLMRRMRVGNATWQEPCTEDFPAGVQGKTEGNNDQA